MIIREARAADLEEIAAFYDMMCEEMGKKDFLPEGNKGGFPPREMLVLAIRDRQLYVGEVDGKIMAAYILNHEADPAYDTAPWQVEIPREQASVMHALRVNPAYGGRGYGARLVRHAIETARKKGDRALRLDCLDDNMIALKMYRSCGFRDIGTIEICYVDIGVPRKCLLYEKLL